MFVVLMACWGPRQVLFLAWYGWQLLRLQFNYACNLSRSANDVYMAHNNTKSFGNFGDKPAKLKKIPNAGPKTSNVQLLAKRLP